MKGREELEGPRPLGDYLTETKSGRAVLLRGKFRGAYIDTVPAGYIGRFLLVKCREDMTPKEIELCERYAGDSTVKKIRRRVKMTEKSKVQIEVEAGKGISEAFDKAAEHGCAEISLTIPVPQSKQKATALDKLRMRGTPLELIGSCLVAGDPEQAQAAFRSCVLEHVYERLAEKYHATCKFEGRAALSTNPNNDALTRDHVGHGVPFTEAEEAVADETTAPVTKVELQERVTAVTDDVQATVLRTIEEMAQDVEKVVEQPLGRHVARLGNDCHVTFGIIPDLSSVKLEAEANNTKLHTSGRIVLYASIETPA